jgi:hypothetical protein
MRKEDRKIICGEFSVGYTILKDCKSKFPHPSVRCYFHEIHQIVCNEFKIQFRPACYITFEFIYALNH